MKKTAVDVLEDLFRSKYGEKTLESARELKLFLLHAKKFIAKEFPGIMVFDALNYTMFCLFGEVPLDILRKSIKFYVDVMEEKERDEKENK